MAKVVKKANICVVVRKYTNSAGEEKSIWKTIGELTTFQKDDGTYSTMAELYNMPSVRLGVFEQKKKEQAVTAQEVAEQEVAEQEAQGEDEINVSNIPF